MQTRTSRNNATPVEMLSGLAQFTVAGETRIAEAGDSYAIPGEIGRAAHFLESTVLIELFSPPREAYA